MREMGLEQVRVEALVGIAPYLPAHLLKEALSIAMAVSDTDGRSEALVGLSNYLPEEDLERAMKAAERIGQDLNFWMPETLRDEIIHDLRRNLGADRLQSECGAIAQAVRDAQKDGTPVPPLTAQWAELAVPAASSVTEGARILSTQIRELIKRGDTGQALTWVNAGEVLAKALKELNRPSGSATTRSRWHTGKVRMSAIFSISWSETNRSPSSGS